MTRWLGIALPLLAGILLSYAAVDLPAVGDPTSPASRNVSPRYIERGYEETHAPNLVTAVLADYRGWDTLGETIVVFAAGIVCLLVLGGVSASAERPFDDPFGSPILDLACRLLVPPILLFALYVVIHGHYSPGGGFQGGTILAAAIILLRLVEGKDARWVLGRDAAIQVAAVGAGIYAAIGLLPLALGGNFLDYGALPLPGGEAEVRALGTLGIEVGVTVCVMGVLVAIFCALGGTEA